MHARDLSIGSVFSDLSTSLFTTKPINDLSNSLTLSETALGVTGVGYDVTLSSESTSDLFSSLNQTELSLRLDKLKREGKREQIGWELEKKELLHKLQIVTLELSQQKLRVETEEAQRLTDIEELEESLQTARAQIQMLQVFIVTLEHSATPIDNTLCPHIRTSGGEITLVILNY